MVEVPLPELYDMARGGAIKDAKTLVIVQRLMLAELESLRAGNPRRAAASAARNQTASVDVIGPGMRLKRVKDMEAFMLGWALTFLIIALIAALLGFGGIAGTAVGIAKIIFFVAIVLFLISAIAGAVRGRAV